MGQNWDVRLCAFWIRLVPVEPPESIMEPTGSSRRNGDSSRTRRIINPGKAERTQNRVNTLKEKKIMNGTRDSLVYSMSSLIDIY